MALRKISLPGNEPPKPAPPPPSPQQSHARLIRELPAEQLGIIVKAMQDGISHVNIAKFFSEQGWLRVSEKSFLVYLSDFRTVYPELLQTEDDYDAQMGGLPRGANLNGVVDPRQPNLDEENMLEQLVRLQSMRLRVGFTFEKSTGIHNQHLSKDVLAMNEVLKTLGSMRGKLHGAGRPSGTNASVVGNEAAEALRKVDQSEAAQEKMAGLAVKLAGLVMEKNRA